MSRYINPYTDFGFKKLFGEEANKDLLIDFLNQLLPAHHQIQSLQFKNTEKLPLYPDDHKAFFDISCVSHSGEHFIVEMQKARMDYFKDRAKSLLDYWSNKAVLDTAFAEGKEEGIAETKLSIAQQLKAQGFALEIIIQVTGLSQAEIERL